MAVRYLTSGNDSFSFDAASDTLRGFAADLSSLDVIFGGDGAGRDWLLFYDAVSLDFRAGGNASGLSGFEQLFLAKATNSVVLTDTFVAGAWRGTSSAGYFTVSGNDGNDTVDASLVAGGGRVAFVAGLGADRFIGGAGNDIVWFAPSALTAADRIDGGAGVDAIAFTGAGHIPQSAFANVRGIERIMLHQNGNSVVLDQAMVASATGGFAVIGGAGYDWVDATRLSTAIGFTPGGGDDVFLGGSGNDQINIAIADLTSGDRFDGGAGRDRIGFLTAGTITASMLSGLSSIETLSLSSAGANFVTLGTNLPDVNVAGGSAADTVTLALPTQYASLGAGDDTLIVRANSVPALSSYGKEGFDTIRTVGAGTFTIGAGIVEFEQIVMQDAATLDLTGTVMALAVVGSSGNDVIRLGPVAQNVTPGGGDDTLRWAARTDGGHTINGFVAGGAQDRFAFKADAFALANGQAGIVVVTDTSPGGAIAPLADVVCRAGLADAAAVDAYLAGAQGVPTGGLFVLGQVAPGGPVALYYDPDAAVAGGAGQAVLLALLAGTTNLAAFTAADFSFF